MVDPKEWTDDEWLAVMRTVPPDAPAEVGEAAVAEMRGRPGHSAEDCYHPHHLTGGCNG